MIAFVKEAEALQEKGQLERLKNEEGELKVGERFVGGCSEEGGRGQGGEEGGGDGYSVIRIAIRSFNSEFFTAWKPGIEMINSHSELITDHHHHGSRQSECWDQWWPPSLELVELTGHVTLQDVASAGFIGG